MTSQSWVQNERRAQRRMRVLLSGQIEGAGGMSTACVVKNCSELGVRVEFPAGLAIPEQVLFSWKRDEAPRAAKVIWRTSSAAGLQFTTSAH